MGLRNYGAFKQFNPQNWSFGFGVGASIPLFTRFQTSNQIAQAEAAATDAEHDLRASQLDLERQVRASIIDLTNAHRSLILADERADLSRQRQELAQEQYRMGGSISFTELQQMFDRTAEAERQALEARFTFINARIALEALLGAPLEN
jgi:outer membrane protein TolC